MRAVWLYGRVGSLPTGVPLTTCPLAGYHGSLAGYSEGIERWTTLWTLQSDAASVTASTVRTTQRMTVNTLGAQTALTDARVSCIRKQSDD